MPGLSITGLLTTLFVYIFSRLAQASVQALYNVLISLVVLGPGLYPQKWYSTCGSTPREQNTEYKHNTYFCIHTSTGCPKKKGDLRLNAPRGLKK